MLKWLSVSALAAALLLVAAGTADAAPKSPPGFTRMDPVPSPGGLFIRGSHGFGVIIEAGSPESGHHSRASVEFDGADGTVRYSVDANLAGEGIQANFGRFGRFSTVAAHRIRWRRDWYGPHAVCGIGVSEGMPGPGAILEAGHADDIFGPVHLFVVQNGAGAEVSYSVHESETIGRIAVSRSAFAEGGPKTLTVGPGFRTGEVSPPRPSPVPAASNAPKVRRGPGSAVSASNSPTTRSSAWRARRLRGSSTPVFTNSTNSERRSRG